MFHAWRYGFPCSESSPQIPSPETKATAHLDRHTSDGRLFAEAWTSVGNSIGLSFVPISYRKIQYILYSAFPYSFLANLQFCFETISSLFHKICPYQSQHLTIFLPHLLQLPSIMTPNLSLRRLYPGLKHFFFSAFIIDILLFLCGLCQL